MVATKGERAEISLDRARAAEAELRGLVRSLNSVLVAFSGGIDSSVVTAIAAQELPGRSVAATATSELFLPEELAAARALTRRFGIEHVEVPVEHLAIPGVAENSPDRCYHCKLALFGQLQEIQRLMGLRWLADGANTDDAADHRPGGRAAAELGVRSPLAEAGIGKPAIRAIARSLGLPDADRPAMACYASRFPYGTRIDSQGLARVRRGERALIELGFEQVRLRDHGPIARLEVDPAALDRLVAVRGQVVAALTDLGYLYVCADLAGYRQGSLNESLARDDQ